ncbi:MAG: YcxB family protein [Clostridiales bacterium]|jgi:hypothetical protein|nr:YcxB family protein [Clostridiales bacterium]
MPIKFKNTVDYNAYKDFVHVMFFGKGYRFIPFLISVFLIPAIKLIDIFSNNIIIKSLIIALNLILIVLALRLVLEPKIRYKKESDILSVPKTYTFYDTYFEIQLTTDVRNELSKHNYSDLEKVYDAQNSYILILSGNQEYIISKKGLTNEQADDLIVLLKRVTKPEMLEKVKPEIK